MSSLYLKLTLDKERTFHIAFSRFCRFQGVCIHITKTPGWTDISQFSLCFVFGWHICRDFVILIVRLIKKKILFEASVLQGLWFRYWLFRGINSRAEVSSRWECCNFIFFRLASVTRNILILSRIFAIFIPLFITLNITLALDTVFFFLSVQVHFLQNIAYSFTVTIRHIPKTENKQEQRGEICILAS